MAQVQAEAKPTEAKPIINRTQSLVWLRQMMLIRRFAERAEMLYQKGNKIGGFFHQSINTVARSRSRLGRLAS